MKTYLLPEDLRNDLLAHLYQQPYGSVAKGVQRLEALPALPEVPPAPAPFAPAINLLPPAEPKPEFEPPPRLVVP